MSEPHELDARPPNREEQPAGAETSSGPEPSGTEPSGTGPKRRRRGSRGGRNRNKSRSANANTGKAPPGQPDELPDRPNEGRPQTVEAAERALVRKPQIGDSRPAQADAAPAAKSG